MRQMKTPKTRSEFERAIYLTVEQIRQGRFHIPARMGSGLEDVRFLPNGRVDFLSVNELARLQANMTAQMEDGMFQDVFDQHKSNAVQHEGTSNNEKNNNEK
jgi:hypothetical protein